MPRYEFSDGRSFKFWEITLSGRSLTTRWGRLGGKGQSKTKEFIDERTCRRAYDTLVREKTANGYELKAGPVPGSSPAQTLIVARDATLERAILDSPDAVEPRAVYADWLMERGDPRGELMSLQNLLKTEKDPAAFFSLKTKIEKYLQTHERALLGPAVDEQRLFKLEWQGGFIRGIRLSYGAATPMERPFEDVLSDLVQRPAAMLLQDISLGRLGRDDPPGGRYTGALEVLNSQKISLRSLHLGDDWAGSALVTAAPIADFSAAPELFRQLRKLIISTQIPRFRSGQLPHLKTLDVREDLHENAMIDLCSAPWPHLEQLALRAGLQPSGTDLIEPLTVERFPALRQLRVTRTARTSQVIEALAHGPLLQQLNILDLSDGDLTDDGIDLLAEHIDLFRHLKMLYLGGQDSISTRSTARFKDWSFVSLKPNRFFGDLDG